MSTVENPSYLTVIEMVNGWHVDLREWDYIHDEYKTVKTTFPMGSKNQAEIWAKAWSEREGIEIR